MGWDEMNGGQGRATFRYVLVNVYLCLFRVHRMVLA